jgi:metal-sulfur cluster biosynthetic enzyme
MLSKEEVLEKLKPVVDPEMQIGIVDLGLIYDAIVGNEGKSVEVKMTLTTPMCPYGPMLVGQVRDLLGAIPGVEECRVDLVWDPPWDPRTMASDEAKDQLMIW